MIGIHAYSSKADIHPLVGLTQLLSILNFKKFNQDLELHLYTDTVTLAKYQKLGLSGLYDSINTTVLDNYPKNRVSSSFWATPKLWVMKHINQPFAMIDVDLAWKENISKYFEFDMSYLHRESTVMYPLPHRLTSPYGFKWNQNQMIGFRESLPINCGVTVWTNMKMLKDYVDVYFDFVLDNPGELIVDEKDMFYIDKTGAQILAEQWWLGSVEYDWTVNKDAKTSSILDMLSFNFMNRPYDFNKHHDELHINTVYHLWGAKRFYDNGMYEQHLRVVNYLLNELSKFDNNQIREITNMISSTLPIIPNI